MRTAHTQYGVCLGELSNALFYYSEDEVDRLRAFLHDAGFSIDEADKLVSSRAYLKKAQVPRMLRGKEDMKAALGKVYLKFLTTGVMMPTFQAALGRLYETIDKGYLLPIAGAKIHHLNASTGRLFTLQGTSKVCICACVCQFVFVFSVVCVSFC
jgi:hypothetical protein